MSKAEFLKLLQKYLKGNATIAERQLLFSYYEIFNSEPDIRDLMDDAEIETLKDEINNSIWEIINQREKEDLKIKPIYKRNFIISAAAVVLVLFTTGILLFLINVEVQQNNISQIPNQEHRLIHLPDGSIVIIEKGSKLEYPDTYNNLDKREVILEGLAYFDVKHDTLKPFVVHTGNLKTTVLGTSFNIKAWPEDEDVSVTVTKGKVKVGNENKVLGTVVQNQQLTFVKLKANIIRKEVDARKHLSWKEQDLLLDDVTISEVAKLLEDRYDVEITCEEELIQPERFTITILKNESLEHVLLSICEFNNASYQYEKDKGLIKIRKKTKRLLNKR